MKTCIIIPMYNFNGMTTECINFVKKNSGIDCNILVVDDGSEHKFEDNRVDIYRHETNLGFTRSVNDAISLCGNAYEYIMLLNNDTEPCENFLKNLVDVMDKDKDIAIASSVRRVPKNGEGSYELEGADWIRGHLKLGWQKGNGVDFVTWVPFCSVILRTNIIHELGLLDKRMKNYCSDNDYCARAIQAGYKVALVHDSEVLHHRGTTILSNKEKLGTSLGEDQKIFLEKLSGFSWQTLLTKMPLDHEQNTWGEIAFEVVKR